MEIRITHPRLEKQRVVVKTAGFLTITGKPKVFLNGDPVKGKTKWRGKFLYTVTDDTGAEVEISIRVVFFDPFPRVTVGEDRIQLAPPLVWLEYVWIALPLLLVVAGGAVGGLIGAIAAYINGRIFRLAQGNFAKYGFTGLVTAASVLIFLGFAVGIQAYLLSR
jgi:hypothetical protein